MDKIIDFNELKNRVNDKDVDQFESYIYSLYYKMAEGKINMSEFSKELGEYMEKNNLSPDKFLKMQTKLMERYGIDASGFEEQLKSLGLENISTNPADYEKTRRTLMVLGLHLQYPALKIHPYHNKWRRSTRPFLSL